MKSLSATLQQRWDEFAQPVENWQLPLHPADLQRFARFVLQAHRTGRKAGIDFRNLLAPNLRDKRSLGRVAPYLEELYFFGRDVLRVHRHG